MLKARDSLWAIAPAGLVSVLWASLLGPRATDQVGHVQSYVAGFDTDTQDRMVEGFYNIATDFYEWGWGQSFHFAPRWRSESFERSLVRHEHELAHHLDLRDGMQCYDLGCGVAGPLRNIARFTRANITGLTITKYQVGLGNRKIKEDGLQQYGRVVYGNYHEHPFDDSSFDRGYDVEASLHSDDLPQYFREVYRTLKPGGKFAGYGYVWADDFDPINNSEQNHVLNEYLIGNGCSKWYKWRDWEAAITASGMKIVHHRDLAGSTDIPWFAQLQPRYTSLAGFAATPFGMRTTSTVTYVMESLRLAPKGTHDAHQTIARGGHALLVAGEHGWVTPTHLYVLLKPE